MLVIGAVTFVSTVLLSWILTYIVRNQAIRLGVVTVPTSSRHVHERPIPRVGGVAVFTAIAATLLLCRYPTLLDYQLNPDEGEFLSAAHKLFY